MTDKNPTCKCGHRRSEHLAHRTRRITTYTRCAVVTLAIACPCEAFRAVKFKEVGAVSMSIVVIFLFVFVAGCIAAYVALSNAGVN